MKKVVGAACLIAGTAIGAGMIALPMVLAKFGLLASVGVMFAVWVVMYYSSLVNIELCLRAGEGLTLGGLGKHFRSKSAQFVGGVSLALLSYALLSAYLYGGGSTLKALLGWWNLGDYTLPRMIGVFTVFIGAVLLCSVSRVDAINRILFIKLLIVMALLCLVLATKVNISALPLWEESVYEKKSWTLVLPILFTSFGFQVIFHTLTGYCEGKKQLLQRAFFWGSLIPALVYLLWTACVLSALYVHDRGFYQQIVSGGVEVGDLMKALSQIVGWSALQFLSWVLSLLAIITSAIGVGLGLSDAWKKQKVLKGRNGAVVLAVLLPPLGVAIWVPNTFIQALSFAGMILVVIAILLPMYLFRLSGGMDRPVAYPILRHRILMWGCVGFGLLMILCEAMNLFS